MPPFVLYSMHIHKCLFPSDVVPCACGQMPQLQINLVQIYIYPSGPGLQLGGRGSEKLQMDLSDAPCPINESWHALLNSMSRSNAMLLDTRDLSWRGRRSEVFFSLCCLCVEAVCTADSPRDARVLAPVRGRVLTPFCLPPGTPPI